MAQNRPEVVLWFRYINDVLLLWDGTQSDLLEFMTALNVNDRGIRFNFEASLQKINFLDLTISVKDGNFVTSTFFKLTDRNSYISSDSCHYNPWLRAVPFGQFMRLRRNCTEVSVFDEQAAVLSSRFVEKGYDPQTLCQTLEKVRQLVRSSLLVDKPQWLTDNKVSLPFITTYSMQSRTIKKLIQRHWHLLSNDQVLKDLLPDKPQVVFKGASSLGNKIAPSIQDPPREHRHFFQNLTGYYQCKKCQVCSLDSCRDRKISGFVSTSTSCSFQVKPFITCSSEGVVYLIQCPCGLKYVGRTKRALQVRLNEHIGNIRRGFKNHSVSRHYDEVHHRDPSNTLYMGIDKYTPHWVS